LAVVRPIGRGFHTSRTPDGKQEGRTMRRFFGALFVMALVGGGITATALPAMAHAVDVHVYCGPGVEDTHTCGSGGVRNSHTRIYACDFKAEGWGVRTHYQLRNGTQGYVGDGNGSKEGCGDRVVTKTANPVLYFQVCAGRNGADEDCEPRRTA
jgi:hypothetical protein